MKLIIQATSATSNRASLLTKSSQRGNFPKLRQRLARPSPARRAAWLPIQSVTAPRLANTLPHSLSNFPTSSSSSAGRSPHLSCRRQPPDASSHPPPPLFYRWRMNRASPPLGRGDLRGPTMKAVLVLPQSQRLPRIKADSCSRIKSMSSRTMA